MINDLSNLQQDLDHCRNQSDDLLSKLIPRTWPDNFKKSLTPFERDLTSTINDHYNEWVAYANGERIGFSKSKTELFQRCLKDGYKREEFIVRIVSEQEIIVTM